MKKIYKNEVQRLFPILEAIKEGKTIQFNDSGVRRDIDGCDEGFFLDTLVGETYNYRIKPEPKYRPFKNADECWAEMQIHQPFGWVKDKVKGIRLYIVGLNQNRAFTQVGHNYEGALDEFIFADGTPFGILEED